VTANPELKLDDRISLAKRQATEWERIAYEIDAAMIFARADFVNVWTLVCSAA